MPGSSDPEESQLVRVRLRGSGFLKHMVRRISGRLKRIGERHLPVNALTATLESGDSEGSFPKARASGLGLDRVWYSKEDGIGILDQL
jgi:tRNA pseudouridine38-40 synthase